MKRPITLSETESVIKNLQTKNREKRNKEGKIDRKKERQADRQEEEGRKKGRQKGTKEKTKEGKKETKKEKKIKPVSEHRVMWIPCRIFLNAQRTNIKTHQILLFILSVCFYVVVSKRVKNMQFSRYEAS